LLCTPIRVLNVSAGRPERKLCTPVVTHWARRHRTRSRRRQPRQLGEQLALLLDGASARNRALNTETFPTAAAIAAVLIDNAIPTPAA
jgi:hypothetical protein